MISNKKRFIDILKFKSVDRVYNLEWCVWHQAKKIWEKKEFLPNEAIDNSCMLLMGNEYFALDGIKWNEFKTQEPYPWQKEVIIEEDEEYVTFIDNLERKRKAKKAGTVGGQRMCMDLYIDFPVKDRETFFKFKKKFEGNFDERYPKDWEKFKIEAKKIDKPLHLMDISVGSFGFYSMLRNWMGTEGLSYIFYDDPILISEACEFLTEYIINLLSKAVTEVKFDWCQLHEDLAYKNGSLVSPNMFKKFFLSGYKRIIEFLKSNGVEIIIVDTDGNFEALIPLFLEAGVDGFYPIEVAAGMEPVKLRKKYGKSFCMIGGVDKREIAKDLRSIENEIKKLTPVIEEGGFIPTIDHCVPPDVSLYNFKYYLELKSKVLGREI